MSKLKNMAVFSAMLVGVMIYTSPAKSAVCFLPDDDGSCGGGDIEISDDSTSENQCADFNLSQNQRNSKEYDSDCYTCEPCTYNGRTTYKCALNSGATWYGGNLSVCCTNGEKYDSAEGKCCPAGGCAHNCPEGQSWDSSTKSCKCDNGKDANGGICCSDSEHVSDGICCPEKKHNENGECVCDSKYNTDKDGNCVLQTISKPTINIAFEQKTNSLGVGNDGDEYYYKTLKFFSASSDNEYRKVQLKVYPVTTCSSKYTLKSSSVTIDSDEYAHTFFSHCEKDTQLEASSVMKIETLVDNEVAYTYIPLKDNVKGIDFTELTKLPQPIDTGKYYLKYTAGKACKDINSNYVNDEEEDYQECHIRTGHEDVDQEMFSTTYTGVAGIDGKCLDCHWMTCKEAGYVRDVSECPDATKYELYKLDDYIGSDGQCYECINKDFRIDTKRSDCHGVYIKYEPGYETSTGSKINQYYLLPKGSKVHVGVWKLFDTRLCQNADYTLYIDGKKFSAQNDEFTLDDDFIKKYNIDRNAFTIRAEDKINPIKYTAKVEFNVHSRSVIRSDSEYNNPKCYAESAVDIIVEVDDISNDEFMDPKNTNLYVFMDYLSPNKVAEYLPSGSVDINGKRQYITYCNTVDDSGGNGMPILTKRSRFDLYFKNETITLKYDGNMNKCVQLGTEEDNTEFCYDIEFSDYDLSSDVVSDCPPHPEYYCPLYGNICNGYRCDGKPI